MSETSSAGNFVREIIARHLEDGRYQQVVTRFPPEPNGYLHIGHVKAICTDFGLAAEFGGRCHLRMDDTNPLTEETEYVESIKADIQWLGFDWGAHFYHASDHFEKLYQFGEQLISAGRAYVDSLSEEDIRAYRGTVTEPGRPSPYRDRSVAENLDLFRQMRAGAFPDGAHVLRGKADMASKNMKMRDPLLYRIRHAHHHRTGDAWCIYPMYDYAHCISDAIEGITHSLCTLEFENNREIYDWILDQLEWPTPRTRQYEFARLELSYLITSKRKLRALVEQDIVTGWDDPRMPTVAGLRRRGIPASAMRTFVERAGISKANSTTDLAQLEHVIREDLNASTPRVMAVLDPLKVVITGFPDETDWLDAPYLPEAGSETRRVPFTRELYIEREDFMENPPKKFYRLAPGREVRLRYGYFITCTEVIKDDTGTITELRCSYDPATRGGSAPDGRKVKATLHWVSATESVAAEVRLYDRLFSVESPGVGTDTIRDHINPASLTVVRGHLEPSLSDTAPGTRVQFERLGYFFTDPLDSTPEAPIFNRIITLKDAWARIQSRDDGAKKPAKKKPKKQGKGKKKPKMTRDEAKAGKPEALAATLDRYVDALGLSVQDANVLTSTAAISAFFEAALTAHDSPRSVASLITNDLRGLIKDTPVTELKIGGEAVGALVGLLDAAVISSKTARVVLAELVASGGEPEAIVDRDDLRQISDPAALTVLIDSVLARQPDAVADYRAGNRRRMGALIGQVMGASKGKANPGLLSSLLKARLEA
ncbi:MAG: glutamine--tRNA ligase/YqeY domain fusion protein [Myxococcota bacterium]|nr:glutamine--tRNA ligase/YqeY domain fusion protein [Myxococcota bacterium]